MPATPHSLGPITIGSTTLAILDYTLSPDVIGLVQSHSGALHPQAEVIPGANPRITFRCYFADIYPLVGADFFVVATTFDVYLSKFSGVTRSASADHTKLALASSCSAAITINAIAVSQDGTLIADCSAVYLANASVTHPIAITANNNLPALTAAAIVHSLGPTVLDATGLPGDRAFSLDLGHTLEIGRDDGDLYPRTAALTYGEPVLTIEHSNPIAVLAALGLLGAKPATSIIQYARRSGSDGTLGASNGVSLTIATCFARPTDITTAQGRVAMGGIRLVGLSTDATTHPVVVATNATVPAAA